VRTGASFRGSAEAGRRPAPLASLDFRRILRTDPVIRSSTSNITNRLACPQCRSKRAPDPGFSDGWQERCSAINLLVRDCFRAIVSPAGVSRSNCVARASVQSCDFFSARLAIIIGQPGEELRIGPDGLVGGLIARMPPISRPIPNRAWMVTIKTPPAPYARSTCAPIPAPPTPAPAPDSHSPGPSSREGVRVVGGVFVGR